MGSPFADLPGSEPYFGDEFHLPGTHAGNGTRDLSKVTRPNQLIRQCERRMIQHVRGIRAEIEFHVLRNREYLVQRHIYGVQARPVYDVPSHIAERTRSWSRKGIHVEPRVDALPARYRRRISYYIR